MPRPASIPCAPAAGGSADMRRGLVRGFVSAGRLQGWNAAMVLVLVAARLLC